MNVKDLMRPGWDHAIEGGDQTVVTEFKRCELCGGRGLIMKEYPGSRMRSWATCPICKGRKFVIARIKASGTSSSRDDLSRG